jgi:hypothetical protein
MDTSLWVESNAILSEAKNLHHPVKEDLALHRGDEGMNVEVRNK